MQSVRVIVAAIFFVSMHSVAAESPLALRSGPGIQIGKLQPAARQAQRIELAAGWDASSAKTIGIETFGVRHDARRSAFSARRNGWVWQGRIGDAAGHFISLTSHRGVLAGLISTAEGNYEILPLPEGGQALIDIDQSRFPRCEGGLHAQSSEPRAPAMLSAPAIEPTGGNAGNEPIDVLIVYSPQVLAASGGLAQVEAQAHAAVDVTNLAFANSDMTARFNLVDVRAFPRDEVDVYDLEWIRRDPQALAWREETGADLASLWVENSLTNCGAGFIMNSLEPGAFAGDAVQITARSCAIANLVYAHEHGHNMGMQHDPAYGQPVSQALFPWAYGHYVNSAFTTIMSYPYECLGGCQRIAFFSNPDVSHMGYPTGIANQRDNHRVGNVTAPIIAAFRSRATIFADGFELALDQP